MSLAFVRVTSSVVVVASLAVGLVHCETFTGGGPGSDAGTAGEGGEGGGPSAILYVNAQSGDDARSGMSPAAPLKTIGAAVAKAAATQLVNGEIHVCRGTYSETNLAVSHPVSLRGAYDCTSWQRSAGYPNAERRDANETRIVNGASNDQKVTLSVGAVQGIDIEGFTVEGASDVTATTRSVFLGEGSRVHLFHNRIVAGSSTTTNPGEPAAIGLATYRSSGVVDKNRFVGTQSDSGGGPGLILADLVDPGAIDLSDNAFVGGQPKGKQGLYMVYVHSLLANAGPVRIERNVLNGGSPTARGQAEPAIVYLDASGPVTVDFVDNQMAGSRALCAAKEGCSSVGALVIGARANLKRNRFDMGTVSTVPPGNAFVRGIEVSVQGTATIENNVILTAAVPVQGLTLDVIGVAAAGNCRRDAAGVCTTAHPPGTIAIVRHNTIQVASSTPGSTTRALFADAPGMTVEDNLFFGGTVDRIVEFYPCRGASFESFRNNAFAFVNAAQPFIHLAGGLQCPTANFVPLAQLESTLGATVASGNVVSLLGFSAVIRDPNPATWAGRLDADVFDLAANVPCSVARVPAAGPRALEDIRKRTRPTDTASAGAYEAPSCMLP